MIYDLGDWLGIDGIECYSTRHAHTILDGEFMDGKGELREVLSNFHLSKNDFTDAGGGLAKLTQRLRNSLHEYGWLKKNVKTENITDGKTTYTESHEIDHFKEFGSGSIGLEIEWNNKPTFFDRDLSNFRFLHRVHIISLGIIICRGKSIQDIVRDIFHDVYFENGLEALHQKEITKRHKKLIEYLISKGATDFDAYAKVLSSDKYGRSTTHMDTLLKSVEKGIADPCPLILIGIGKQKITDL